MSALRAQVRPTLGAVAVAAVHSIIKLLLAAPANRALIKSQEKTSVFVSLVNTIDGFFDFNLTFFLNADSWESL